MEVKISITEKIKIMVAVLVIVGGIAGVIILTSIGYYDYWMGVLIVSMFITTDYIYEIKRRINFYKDNSWLEMDDVENYLAVGEMK